MERYVVAIVKCSEALGPWASLNVVSGGNRIYMLDMNHPRGEKA